MGAMNKLETPMLHSYATGGISLYIALQETEQQNGHYGCNEQARDPYAALICYWWHLLVPRSTGNRTTKWSLWVQ